MSNRVASEGMTTVLLSICHQHLSAKLNRVFEPLKMNMTQMSILTYLSRLPSNSPETVSHISAVMEMNQPMVTKAVKHMEEQGWLKRKADPTDARSSQLFLTGQGSQQLIRAQEASLPLLKEVYGALKDNELESLQALLGKLKSNLC